MHDVRVSFGRRREGVRATSTKVIEWTETEKIKSYRIDSDMLEIEDTFQVELPARRDTAPLAVPDSPFRIHIDGVIVCTGLIDTVERGLDREGATYRIEGRDKGGRLADESMPLENLSGLGIKQLAKLAAGQWFPNITLSNVKNRRLFRGKGKWKAKVSGEPSIVTSWKHDRKVNPGDTRWSVLVEFLKKGHLLAWSSADGKDLIVGLPNYKQNAQFRFVSPLPGEDAGEQPFIKATFRESVAECYAQIVAVGESKGNGTSYSHNVTRRYARLLDGPNSDGTGRLFSLPKALIIQDSDIKSKADAKDRVKREMQERQSTNLGLEMKVPGLGQWGVPYHFDAMCEVDDRGFFGKLDWMITKVVMQGSKAESDTSDLTLVPKGTILQLGGG